MCNEFIIYPGNLLTSEITATIEEEDGSTSDLNFSIYDSIYIHFKRTISGDPVITLSTATGEGLTIDGTRILIDTEIDEEIQPGDVIYDILCTTDAGTVTYGPGTARILPRITIPAP